MGSTRRRGRGGGEPAGVLRGNESKEGERRLTGGTGSSERHGGREESADDTVGPACWATTEREQAAQGKWAAQEARRRWTVRAKFKRGREEEIKLISYFLNTFSNPIQTEIQIPLQIPIKPKHHKIKMQQHGCTYMYVDQYLILI